MQPMHVSHNSRPLLLAAILAVSLTACVKSSGDQEPEKTIAPVAQAQAVVVAAPSADAAPLPEIPKEVRSCLLRKVEDEQKRAKNADGVAEISTAVDKSKRSCAQSHFAWYDKLREQRGPKVAKAEEKPAAKDKKKPAATWE